MCVGMGADVLFTLCMLCVGPDVIAEVMGG